MIKEVVKIEIIRLLSGRYGSCLLRVDGFLVNAEIAQLKMKLVIAVYVNGSIDFKHHWHGKESEVGEMNEVARRFWCRRTHGRSAKDIKSVEKIFGKRECKRKNFYDRYVYTSPYFNSPGAFLKHIATHNESVELIDYDDYRVELEKQKGMAT